MAPLGLDPRTSGDPSQDCDESRRAAGGDWPSPSMAKLQPATIWARTPAAVPRRPPDRRARGRACHMLALNPHFAMIGQRQLLGLKPTIRDHRAMHHYQQPMILRPRPSVRPGRRGLRWASCPHPKCRRAAN